MLCTWARQIPSCADKVRAPTRPTAVRHPGEYLGLPGGVAHSYLTTGHGWQTIWRTLANPGE
ncbi:hypothetical protein GCM10010221_69830 [Streptomyces parvus]|uniref:Uncharacterized protein n=1 Tax=Streptomyces badius TaxID=1941 RepID=A0ABQ2T8J7_STRBA|nr:hypothetical protein GCM10010231_15990 [Streptomyces sindenensis]GGS58354.1 hypothetical protein GCM10010253_36190 [Streptomyces badius]GGS60958.1 hypothetical protein GCM10010221_69830 [Streptomyces parvus]